MEEDFVKRSLEQWLQAAGWTTAIAWGHAPGIDVEAKKVGARWLIEAKGAGSRPQMARNYFFSIIGDTLQRMSDAQTTYSIALPDLPVFRNLWLRFPVLAKQRMQLTLLLIDSEGRVSHLRE